MILNRCQNRYAPRYLVGSVVQRVGSAVQGTIATPNFNLHFLQLVGGSVS
ncbi:MAG: hypothetical protein V7K77_13515 [Nostoc sp.]